MTEQTITEHLYLPPVRRGGGDRKTADTMSPFICSQSGRKGRSGHSRKVIKGMQESIRQPEKWSRTSLKKFGL